MSNSYVAAPMSRGEINGIAHVVRDIFSVSSREYFPVVDFLELGLPQLDKEFVLEIAEIHSMRQYAIAYPGEHKIRIREDVYNNACNGIARDRFTIAHEIGHYILHTPNRIGLARTAEKPKPYLDPEWQADTFAGELLAPSNALKGLALEEITRIYGVSKTAAGIQMRYAK